MTVDLVDLSRSLGVGARGTDGEVGRNAPVRRTMERLVQFRLATWLGEDRLGVLTKVPAVSRHHADAPSWSSRRRERTLVVRSRQTFDRSVFAAT